MGKIFGIGAHKTATRSLYVALGELGYKATHWDDHNCLTKSFLKKNYRPAILNEYDAILDFPAPLFYKEIDKAYPGSKFILTLRNVDEWIKSVEKLLGNRDLVHEEFLFYNQKIFKKELFIDRYLKHNREVVEYFHKRPNDLLVMNIFQGDGWEKIANFLQKEIPNQYFPHVNQTEKKEKKEQTKKHHKITKKDIYNYSIFLRDDTVDEKVLSCSIVADLFLKNNGLPEYEVGNNHVVIDIGAHIGAFALYAAGRAQNGKVFAFEPEIDNFNLLQKNIDLNKSYNITACREAVYDSVGSSRLYYDIENWGHTLVKKFPNHSEIVPTTTLSNIFLKHDIKKCDFLKLNCEGAEYEIIIEAPTKLFEKIDKIFILYHIGMNSKYSVADLISRLKELNYKIRSCAISKKRRYLIACKNDK